ncbi:unnamed protein product [Darwinula stevensoni]|uniref:Sushi domain-containing protein n=1 Tax=Darwinula stevensoni TaxID=69355 RepID=A0A7R9A261_9CRUS|nr:unnamed protein product [Darwinula stevensoni]CAG0888041.1 unnamed protein product [Darwinula stevensoni]
MAIPFLFLAVHCPEIPEQPGLQISTRNTQMKTRVLFSCLNGTLIGAEEMECLPSGNWSDPIPTCENVECGSQPNVTDSKVRVTVRSRQVGGTAEFRCPEGFGLQGPRTATCSPDGEWTKPLPTCEESAEERGGLLPHRTESCLAVPVVPFHTCNRKPAEVACQPPPAPENSHFEPKEGPFKGGDVLHFLCHKGFMPEGQPIIVCQEDGTWSKEPPKCVRSCGYLGTLIGGSMSVVKHYYTVGETVSFECEAGRVLSGPAQVRCLENGKWSGGLPMCTKTK